MIDNYKLTLHDYKIRYSGTYIGYESITGEILPYYVSDVLPDKGYEYQDDTPYCRLYGTLYTVGGKKSKYFSVNNKRLKTNFPINGAVNTPSGLVILMDRSIMRQWRHTIYEDVINVSDPYRDERKLLNLQPYEGLNNVSILRTIFNHRYYSMKDAYDFVRSGKRIAAAFTPIWHVGNKFREDNMFLFNRNNKVGIITKDRTVIPKSIDFLKEELSDLNIKYEVCSDESWG